MMSGLSSYLDDWFRSIHTPGNTKTHILLILFPVIMDNDDNNNNRLLHRKLRECIILRALCVCSLIQLS